MKILILAGTLILAALASAQDAKVIELAPADTDRAQRLWDAKKEADKAWANMRQEIENNYLYEGEGEIPSISGMVATVTTNGCSSFISSCAPLPVYKEPAVKYKHPKDGWYSFDFSTDFRFIVPKESPKIDGTTFRYNGPIVSW